MITSLPVAPDGLTAGAELELLELDEELSVLGVLLEPAVLLEFDELLELGVLLGVLLELDAFACA